MSDIAFVAASMKITLLEIAKQSAALGTGLQNAAPGKSDSNPSVQYLLRVAEQLTSIADKCEIFLAADTSRT